MIAFFKVILYQPLYNLLIFFAWLIPGHSLGWSIVVLTALIRIVLLPNSIKAAKAQARIQALQPKVNAIRKQHKEQVEQSKALMALYKEEGVSQFGSCLPMLIQLPILIVLYQVFRGSLDTVNFSLLYSFTPHLAAINTNFLGMDISKPELWVLPILAGVTQYILTRMTVPPVQLQEGETPDPTQMMFKQMNVILPIMTVFFARVMPAAAAIYWVITTLFSIGQQWYVNKSIRPQFVGVASGPKEISAPVPVEQKEKKVFDKSALVSKVLNRRLEKQEKKGGVTVTIRKKG